MRMDHIFCHCKLNLLTALAKKNLLADARLSPDLRTQVQFGRLKDPTFGLLATPMRRTRYCQDYAIFSKS